jgi:hypothetical protein
VTAKSYFSDAYQAEWQKHYFHDSRGFLLSFTREWKKANLPIGIGDVAGYDYDSKALKVDLLDTDDPTGKVYTTYMPAAYGDPTAAWALDENWQCVDSERITSLQDYFYSQHHCPCHRKSDAKAAGAVVPDSECEGSRFKIKSITCRDMPDVILYSETMTEEELENLLQATREKSRE